MIDWGAAASKSGAEIEKPLAIVLIGGLITSMLFTLIVLPAVYLAARQVRQRWSVR